jgi:hypothetical protein
MNKITLFLAVSILLIITSCKKEEEEKPKTRTELLTAKPWKLTALTVNPGINIAGTTITDFYTQLPSCEKDNIEKYNIGGTGFYDEGASKCNPSAPQTRPFTWIFNPSETILTIDGESANILQLDATTLKVTSEVEGSEIGGTPGLRYTITGTYSNN